MSRTVLVVRHAMPAASADLAPAQWALSDSGRTAAGGLADQLPKGAVLASSTETKAIQTLALAAGVAESELYLDARFGEVLRPGEPFDDDVADRRRAWIEGRIDDRHQGWETQQAAGRRFAAGVDALAGDPIVIGSHGMIITSWLVALGIIEAGSAAGDYWAGLGFPELIEVAALGRGSRVTTQKGIG